MSYILTAFASMTLVGVLLTPGAETPPRRNTSGFGPNVVTDRGRPGIQEIDYHRPPQSDGQAPLVVILHGGGNKGNSELNEVAAAIAKHGAVVAVPSYYSGQPRSQEEVLETFENVVCSVRNARAQASELGADPDNLTLVGFSYGGFPALATALSPDEAYDFPCLPEISHVPQAVIGVGGAYGYDTQVSTLGWPDGFAEYTAAGHIGINPDLPVMLLHGAHDTNSPIDSAMKLYDGLADAGHRVAFEVFDPRHAELIEPDDEAGARVVEAIIEVARGKVSIGRFGLEPISAYSGLSDPRRG